ncbi:GIP [Symbiodinium sp. CCMP2592]|nr:GIP [Symbiodinium sp. CCMP2592]
MEDGMAEMMAGGLMTNVPLNAMLNGGAGAIDNMEHKEIANIPQTAAQVIHGIVPMASFVMGFGLEDSEQMMSNDFMMVDRGDYVKENVKTELGNGRRARLYQPGRKLCRLHQARTLQTGEHFSFAIWTPCRRQQPMLHGMHNLQGRTLQIGTYQQMTTCPMALTNKSHRLVMGIHHRWKQPTLLLYLVLTNQLRRQMHGLVIAHLLHGGQLNNGTTGILGMLGRQSQQLTKFHPLGAILNLKNNKILQMNNIKLSLMIYLEDTLLLSLILDLKNNKILQMNNIKLLLTKTLMQIHLVIWKCDLMNHRAMFNLDGAIMGLCMENLVLTMMLNLETAHAGQHNNGLIGRTRQDQTLMMVGCSCRLACQKKGNSTTWVFMTRGAENFEIYFVNSLLWNKLMKDLKDDGLYDPGWYDGDTSWGCWSRKWGAIYRCSENLEWQLSVHACLEFVFHLVLDNLDNNSGGGVNILRVNEAAAEMIGEDVMEDGEVTSMVQTFNMEEWQGLINHGILGADLSELDGWLAELSLRVGDRNVAPHVRAQYMWMLGVFTRALRGAVNTMNFILETLQRREVDGAMHMPANDDARARVLSGCYRPAMISASIFHQAVRNGVDDAYTDPHTLPARLRIQERPPRRDPGDVSDEMLRGRGVPVADVLRGREEDGRGRDRTPRMATSRSLRATNFLAEIPASSGRAPEPGHLIPAEPAEGDISEQENQETNDPDTDSGESWPPSITRTTTEALVWQSWNNGEYYNFDLSFADYIMDNNLFYAVYLLLTDYTVVIDYIKDEEGDTNSLMQRLGVEENLRLQSLGLDRRCVLELAALLERLAGAAEREDADGDPLRGWEVNWGVALLEHTLRRLTNRLDELGAVLVTRLGPVGRLPPEDIRGAFSEACQPFVHALTASCLETLQDRLRDAWLDPHMLPDTLIHQGGEGMQSSMISHSVNTAADEGLLYLVLMMLLYLVVMHKMIRKYMNNYLEKVNNYMEEMSLEMLLLYGTIREYLNHYVKMKYVLRALEAIIQFWDTAVVDLSGCVALSDAGPLLAGGYQPPPNPMHDVLAGQDAPEASAQETPNAAAKPADSPPRPGGPKVPPSGAIPGMPAASLPGTKAKKEPGTTAEGLPVKPSAPAATTAPEVPGANGKTDPREFRHRGLWPKEVLALGNPTLRWLSLSGCRALRKGLAHLRRCQALRFLDLFECDYVDAGEVLDACMAPQVDFVVWPSLEHLLRSARKAALSQSEVHDLMAAALDSAEEKRHLAHLEDVIHGLPACQKLAKAATRDAAARAAQDFGLPFEQTKVAKPKTSLFPELLPDESEDEEEASAEEDQEEDPQSSRGDLQACIHATAFVRRVRADGFKPTGDIQGTRLFRILDADRDGVLSKKDFGFLDLSLVPPHEVNEAIGLLLRRHQMLPDVVASDLAGHGSQIDLKRVVECMVIAGVEEEIAKPTVAGRSLLLLLTEASLESKEAGPLTDELYAQGFSTVTVPIGPVVILAIVILILLLAVHEGFVAAGAKPLLANHEKPNSLPLQCTFATNWLLLMVTLSMLVPDSLDYALAMGHSATASGVFLSAPFVLAMIGNFLGRPLTSEVNWDQRFARNLCVGCQGVTVAGSLTLAFLMQAASHWSEATKQTSFWCFLLVSSASQFFNALPIVAWATMWNVVTPNSQKTIWSMIAIACRHCGLVFGPMAFAALSFSVRKGRDISPISLMGWSYVGLAMFQALALTTACLCLPTVVSPPTEDRKAATEDEQMELSPEELAPESREEIVKNNILYCYERTFTVAALEVSTMMLLEVQYGWSKEACGASFVTIGVTTVATTIISTILVSRKWIRESWLFLGSTLISLSGVFLLFDWRLLNGAFGGSSLLFADSLVYAFSGVSNGIAQGWAARAAMKGTKYDIQTYRVQNMAAVQISRFLVPALTRFIVDFGGRNVYVLVQLLMCAMGTSTVWRTVSLVWRGAKDGQSQKATAKSSGCDPV